MADLEINLPDRLNARLVPQVVEEVCASAHLHVMMRSTLKKFPGCVHWHFKRGKEKGTLEVTWWPRDGDTRSSRLWLSVHGGRAADWMQHVKPHIKATIELRLANQQAAK